MIDIKALLPQRDPFLFVDALLAVEYGQIIGMKKYERDFSFCQQIIPGKQVIPGVILLESLVQCGGAGLAWLGMTGRDLWGLALLEKVRWRGIVEPPATVTMKVNTLKVTNKILRQSGTGFWDDKPVLTATWCCLKISDG